jgi:hypothetical protein
MGCNEDIYTFLTRMLCESGACCYVDNINVVGGGIHTIKEKIRASVVASKEICLAVNANKT